VDTRLEAGRVHFMMAEYDQAAAVYQSILDETPEDADALWGLGDTYRMMERTDEALDLIQRALRAQPDHPYAQETLRLIREQR
jgi:tetratricopeptide (TPR) repeat protein